MILVVYLVVYLVIIAWLWWSVKSRCDLVWDSEPGRGVKLDKLRFLCYAGFTCYKIEHLIIRSGI